MVAIRYTVGFIGFAFVLSFFFSLGGYSQKIKSYAEKKQIAEEMKKVAKALGVKCNYCHIEADRGLRAGDFTLLTKKGSFAHDHMFPLAEKFKTNCGYCHNGYEKFTAVGERSVQDADYIREYNKKSAKKINCETCHVAPQNAVERPFQILTDFAQKMR